MPIRSHENTFGAWAFLVGVVLAIIIGILSGKVISAPGLIKYSPAIYGTLVILGLVIGFLGVTGKDSQTFLFAGAILVIVSRFGIDGAYGSLIGIGLGDIISSTFSALLALFVPATIVVALKTLFSISTI